MLEAIEKRGDPSRSESIFPPSPDDLYAALNKKAKSVEEVTARTPKALTLIETYYQDFQILLSQEPMITSVSEIRTLQGNQTQLEADFQSQMQGYHCSRQELIALQEQILEREKETRRKIAVETNAPWIIINRARVKIYEQRKQLNRRLPGRIAARIPGVAIPVHPLVIPIIWEKERIQAEIKTTEEETATTKVGYRDSLNPLKKSLTEKQDHLSQTFILWVTDNPQRLLAHLVLLPDDIPSLRKAFHRRFAENRKTRMTLDAELQELGLLVKTSPEDRTQITNACHGKMTSREQSISDNGWGFVFVEYDPDTVIQSEEDLTRVVRTLLEEKRCPPQTIKAIIRGLLRFQADPFRSGRKVDTVKGEALRGQLGKDKLYFPTGWRAFFELLKTDGCGNIIEIHRLIPHGEWEKKY